MKVFEREKMEEVENEKMNLEQERIDLEKKVAQMDKDRKYVRLRSGH
jgi:hypothetical protein